MVARTQHHRIQLELIDDSGNNQSRHGQQRYHNRYNLEGVRMSEEYGMMSLMSLQTNVATITFTTIVLFTFYTLPNVTGHGDCHAATAKSVAD